MALYYEPEKNPTDPSGLAHHANALAPDFIVAQQSREALERRIRREQDHPIHQKYQEAVVGRRLLISSILALAFWVVAWWEWAISNELYDVWFPGYAFGAFVACVVVGFYVSVCLAESTSHFALFRTAGDSTSENGSAVRRAVESLYDERQKKTTVDWLVHPATGILLASFFLYGIYWGSMDRVAMQAKANEDFRATFHVYLPVFLYGIEIVLGVFFAHWLNCLYGMVLTRFRRTSLAQAKHTENTLRQGAIEQYTQYLGDFGRYNGWADQNQQPRALLVLPNAALRQLLPSEWGYDPTQSSSGPAASNGGPTSSTSVNGDRISGPAASSPTEDEQAGAEEAPSSEPSMTGEGRPATTAGGTSSPTEEVNPVEVPVPPGVPPHTPPTNSPREDDLLRLLDEVITTQNNRF